VARDKAVLAVQEAEVDRVKALLQQAQRDEARAKALEAENEDYISQKEMDAFHFATLSLKAQLRLSEANVEQAAAALRNSEANLGYTDIRSPVDGMIIDRKIDEGQTLAAQFQTPELFIVAPDMEKKMHVFASVDEADIGLIRDAQLGQRPVEFRVDAYPDDLFTGQIEQIRLSSTTTQNVVTYPVVVAAPNPDLKLLPGMTASISFVVDERNDVLKVPNAALRFFPELRHVRAEDRPLVEGKVDEMTDSESEGDLRLSAAEQTEVRRSQHRRHVWIADGNLLRAVEVELGISDSRSTELVSGDLAAGDKLVTGIKPNSG
jgi:HlyD family secretion protein